MRKTTPKSARSARGDACALRHRRLPWRALVGLLDDEKPYQRRQPGGNALHRDHERQELVPIAEHPTAPRAGPRQRGQRHRQTDRHHRHGRRGGGPLRGLGQGPPEEVELHPQGEQQQRDDADHLLEERRADRALTQGRHRAELLRQGHRGDFGRHLLVEGPDRVEVEEVVEGRGGEVAHEGSDDERDHGPHALAQSAGAADRRALLNNVRGSALSDTAIRIPISMARVTEKVRSIHSECSSGRRHSVTSTTTTAPKAIHHGRQSRGTSSSPLVM